METTQSTEHTASQHDNTQMDNSDEFSDVNFDEDGDDEHSASAEESESIEHTDHNICDDSIENSDSVVIDGRFVRIKTMTANDIEGLDFGSEKEAYDFYVKYAKCTGFVVRKDFVNKNVRGTIVTRQFVCNRQGERSKKHLTRVDRKRDHRPITRINCDAHLRIHYNVEKLIWEVTAFEARHNHELTPSKFIHLFPAYRGMTDADKAQIDSLHSNGIQTCHIMGHMVANKGGYDAVGFTKKDLYNYFGKKTIVDIKDGDVVASLSYLRGKAGLDPMLYAKYTIGSNGKLKRLFWADGRSRNDFLCFGDVIAFDATYKKNKYNFPLVIFSGCNNHSQTIIFGAALVSDETTETYKWVLSSFLEAMGNRQPKAVMTDGDLAMREAVRVVFPETCHRLCAWHLNKNAYENVKKKKDFLTNFNKAMYSNFTVEEFEEFWANLVETNGLQGHTWVSKTYENKKLWATAYFQDMFFGRIRTTSQCEAINSMMKRYVRKKCSIYEFMHKFDQALREYRNNEHVADFQSYSSDPVLTTGLNSIEKDASKIYTLEMFKEVKKQIVKSSALIVSEREEVEDKLMFKLTKTCDTKYEKEVFYDTANSSFYCQCRLFEARGIPCSHIIFVMKEEHVDHIPSGLILKRWTKNAKNRIMASNVGKGLDSNMTDVDRCGAYSAACNRFCKVAAESGACFNDVMDDILKLTEKYSNLKLRGSVRTQNSEMDKHIGDPDAVNSKGAPKKNFRLKRTKHRSKCTDTKHNVRTCPIRIDVNGSLIDNDKDAAKFSKATSISDTEMSRSDVNNIHGSVRSTKCGREIDKNAKEKSNCNTKQKKAKEMNETNHHIRGEPMMSQVQPNAHQMHYPMPHFANSSQVPPHIYAVNGQTPPIGGLHMMSQLQPNAHQMLYATPNFANSSQVHAPTFVIDGQTPPILQQPPQYFFGMPATSYGSSCLNLLQQVTNKGGQSSGKNVRP